MTSEKEIIAIWTKAQQVPGRNPSRNWRRDVYGNADPFRSSYGTKGKLRLGEWTTKDPNPRAVATVYDEPTTIAP